MEQVLKNYQNISFESAGHFWKIYQNQDYYFKILAKHYVSKKLDYAPILELLKKEYHIDGMPNIIEIFYNNEKFEGYCMEKMPGIKLHDYIDSQTNSLYAFTMIAERLINFLKEASAKNIVIKDLTTKGNIIFDKDSQKLSFLDLDGMQVENNTDRLLKGKIINSYLYKTLLSSMKYHSNHFFSNVWYPEFNFFLFYELFFNTVFHISMFSIDNYGISIEEQLKIQLNMIGIPKNFSLYEKILNLANINCPNNADASDFLELANLPFDQTRKRIIS